MDIRSFFSRPPKKAKKKVEADSDEEFQASPKKLKRSGSSKASASTKQKGKATAKKVSAETFFDGKAKSTSKSKAKKQKQEEEDDDVEYIPAVDSADEDVDDDVAAAILLGSSDEEEVVEPSKKAKPQSPAKTKTRSPSKTAQKSPAKPKVQAKSPAKPKVQAKSPAKRPVVIDSDSDDDEGGGGFVPAAAKKPKARPLTGPKKSPAKAKAPPAKKPKTEEAAAGEEADGDKEQEGGDAKPKKFNYYAFKSQREQMAPPKLGQKDIPEGEENCLHGLRFVVTGVLESLERDQATDLIKRYGGHIQSSVGKRLDYLVAGEDAGPKKMEKAKDLKIKVINEDGLFELIRSRKGKKVDYMAEAKAATPKKKGSKTSGSTSISSATKAGVSSAPSTSSAAAPSASAAVDDKDALWTVKYAPKSMDKIIGQNGPRSNANKLKHWLNNWHRNLHRKDKKPLKSDDGWEKKAVLMYGAPGIGKTTTAQVVCQECGYEAIELNASDARSKKLLEQHLAPLVGNCTMTQFYGKDAQAKPERKKMAIIMDEVDGMAGNEDRGGVAEIIKLIKQTKMPIICICNDLPPKLKSLRAYCFELSFHKIPMQKLKSAFMSICFKEGIKITPYTLEAVIEAANGDVRQILNNLYMWSRRTKDLSGAHEKVKHDAQLTIKHVNENPWTYVPKFFQPGLKLESRIDAFFQDYSFAPMWVQENYLRMHPRGVSNPIETLQRVANAADAIAVGDRFQNVMMSNMDFKLLPMMAVQSCVLPGFYLRGGSARIEFSQWFGQNSKAKKHQRMLSDLQQHMRMSLSADTKDLRLAYLPVLRNRLGKPLAERGAEGIDEVMEMLDSYNLTRADWDGINEVCQMGSQRDVMHGLESKVKAAFTRAYNKSGHKLPYAQQAAAKKSKRGGSSSMSEFGMGEEEEDTQVDDEEGDNASENPENDAMIKAKKPSKRGAKSAKSSGAPASKRPKTTKRASSSSKSKKGNK